METLSFILHNLPAIGERTLEHISIVGVAVGIAILTGVPIGIAITQSQRIADTILYLGSIVITIPSIALFGVLIPILSKIGQGYSNKRIARTLEISPETVKSHVKHIFLKLDVTARSEAVSRGVSLGLL